ncbi:Cbb3-type cytochrome c oxidase subunit CcoP2 [Polaribacter huanghezhanensis]|uniref:cbb3-type cytochrome c oxidase N-terminal domain-containing protein n=1 Tax=Polaribacter huanghezhanensis TaxID=1354726 RepID=UPI002647AC45|nr:cbb3-type cytochrome c oxidase N-terminal domain-containing protein [Polaribacter huanghezhanensis]WKD86209.1 Cbb3-type cytochrome c oxidase subunit CcoP2 [Polaribacter huanghezhanensis]
MKKYIIAIVSVLFIFAMPFLFTEITASYENPYKFIDNPLPWLVLVTFIVLLLMLVWLITLALKKVQLLENEKNGVVPETSTFNLNVWVKKFLQKWTNAKRIDQEEEIILDHNYDGIKELDNSLPPWWVYMFYASIIFAVVYLVRFEVFDGDNQITEYNNAVAEAKASLETYKETATDIIDASTVTLLTDSKDLNRGKAIFNLNCVACHIADGGGSIGPNLTDEYWILGGGIKNVFTTISNGGRDGKGMVAWSKILKPIDVAKVASYIISLQGTKPANPKKPEGEIWKE